MLRLEALIGNVGGRRSLYDLVGGIEHFERLVLTRRQLKSYLGAQRSLPREERLQRIRCFLECVEPAVAADAPMEPRVVRAVLEADIARRSSRDTARSLRPR